MTRSGSLCSRPESSPESDSGSTAVPWRYRTDRVSLSSEEIATLRKWIRQNWKPGGIVQAITQDSPERQMLVREAESLCLKSGVQAGPRGLRTRTWANVQQHDSSEGEYPSIYPHKHAKEPGITLVFYLDCDALHPALEILADDFTVEDEIAPEIGKVALCRNGVYHRVKKNRTHKERVAAIAEVYS